MVSGYLMASKIKTKINCDILICGAGLAGLSLAYRALKSGSWSDQEILIFDNSSKTQNDRTWSFWKKAPMAFDHLIFKSWNNLSVFMNSGKQLRLETEDYTYNSIRSIDFYDETFSFLSACRNVKFYYEEILNLHSESGSCYAETENYQVTARYAFNSIFKKPVLKAKDQYFLQHFKGVIIKTSSQLLDLNEAYLMDFRTGQEHGATFFYTLPLSADELFIEYTLFTKFLLKKETYDERIAVYIKDVLKIAQYHVVSDEYGVIPMTNYRFSRFNGNVVNIGTIGGDTRGATGYTFTNVQKTVTNILESWGKHKHPFFKKENINFKHHLYDATLLNVLDEQKYAGHKLFTDLFRNAKAADVFAFLDATSTAFQELSIITSLKPLPFIKAMTKVLLSK
jgi:lycopene beta-cyclase